MSKNTLAAIDPISTLQSGVGMLAELARLKRNRKYLTGLEAA